MTWSRRILLTVLFLVCGIGIALVWTTLRPERTVGFQLAQATNTKPVREAPGARAQFHSVPGAGHLAFLVLCSILRPPPLCSDGSEFDRTAFHAAMNAGVPAFFKKM